LKLFILRLSGQRLNSHGLGQIFLKWRRGHPAGDYWSVFNSLSKTCRQIDFSFRVARLKRCAP